MKKKLPIKQYKCFLFYLFLFSFFIRALVFGLFLSKERNYFNRDSGFYHQVACQLVEGNGFSNLDGSPHFFRVPGYSLFLSLAYKLFAFSEKIAMWIQLFVGSFLPLLVFFLSLVLFPGVIWLAKASSIFSALHIGFVLFSGFMMTESLFCLFFFLFLLLFLQIVFKGRFPSSISRLRQSFGAQDLRRASFLAGVFLGCAAMFRPVGHYLLIVSLLILLFQNITFKKKWKLGVLLCVGWLLIVFPWFARNYFLTKHVFFSYVTRHSFFNACSNAA